MRTLEPVEPRRKRPQVPVPAPVPVPALVPVPAPVPVPDPHASRHVSPIASADGEDLEPDINTTCAEMGRDHCPYDANYERASILCEWKAKGATNWMVRSTVRGYPYVTEGDAVSGDPLAAADWLRIAFHETGQFMWNNQRGTGDDGSFW